jgi:hypothetical protein
VGEGPFDSTLQRIVLDGERAEAWQNGRQRLVLQNKRVSRNRKRAASIVCVAFMQINKSLYRFRLCAATR